MAHNERPGPLPSLQGVGNSVPRMANRFAKRDPQLYPLFGIMALTLGAAGYFFSVRKAAQADTAGESHTVIRKDADILHSTTHGGPTLEEWKAGTTPGIPANVGAPNIMRETAVPLPRGAEGKVQPR
ncbi:hypothetical protein FRC04_010442 [Tulasnella sp. 424]|nr:hypothetical protein FRC04_010442 [Tulasnella sp. 424]KAG8978626.1 hypothetical protein FRC05_009898 [Tulasnella sp. 425]